MDETANWLQTGLAGAMAATSFEAAAEAVLGATLRRFTDCMSTHPLTASARAPRAGIQLRQGDGLRRVYVLERPRASETVIESSFFPSTSAWQRIEAHGDAIAIDVPTRRASLVGTGAELERDDAPDGRSVSSSTISRLRERDTTHVLILPFRTVRGAVAGALWVEARCGAAIGRPFPWQVYARDVQLLADAAAPHVLAQPPVTRAPDTTDPLLPVTGRSTAGLLELLRAFARQEETLLLAGPTGSGKTRLARWCHARWCEARGVTAAPYEAHVLVSTGAAELQLAELFGWRRGAFTGAVSDNPGAVARAAGGTLFLDEIDKISPSAQAGLLQFLDERGYRVLGDAAGTQKARVRVIVGTSVDLRAAVRSGAFREDLYYRIHVLPVTVPSLGERRDEIAGWARHMASEWQRETRSDAAIDIAPDAIELLERAPWPGNLRQLRSVMRRACALAAVDPTRSHIARADVERALAFEPIEPAGGGDAIVALRRAAAALVEHAQRTGGLDLDLVDGFRGLVVAAAADRTGDRDDGARLLGLGEAVVSRNHHRVLKREIERARKLLAALGGSDDPLRGVGCD